MQNNVSKMTTLTAINHYGSKQEVLREIENDLELDKHIYNINNEVPKTIELNKSLRPLFGKRIEVLEKMSYIDSDIEMEVMLEYPPRKGSEAQREAFRSKQREEHESYPKLKVELKNIDDQISDIQFEMSMIEKEAKNSRRIIEMHTSYATLISKY